MSNPHVEFVEVDGVNLRVASQRGKSGLPLLLFNGIGANLELCFPFMEAMPEREIVIFDVPGRGRLQRVPTREPLRGTEALTGGLFARHREAGPFLSELLGLPPGS